MSLTGSFQTVKGVMSYGGSLYVEGVNTTVLLSLSGQATASIDPSTPTTLINGTAKWCAGRGAQ